MENLLESLLEGLLDLGGGPSGCRGQGPRPLILLQEEGPGGSLTFGVQSHHHHATANSREVRHGAPAVKPQPQRLTC